MITWFAVAIISISLSFGLAFLIYRRARQLKTASELLINTPNKIVEEHFLLIGGVEQWIQIRGENRDNPVILILHGGPGWSNATFTVPLRSWEKHFIVVQWDHRGTGKTLGHSGKPGVDEMSFDLRVSDAIELTEMLCRYLRKEKVILLAESMGTLTGLPLVKRRPDLFSVIIATDLYVDMMSNEEQKYQLTLQRVRSSGDSKGMVSLERIGSNPANWDLTAWNTNMAWAFKTNLPTPNLDRKFLLPLVLFSPIYDLGDIWTLLMGFQRSMAGMFAEIKSFNAWRLGTSFVVPFLLFQGESDVITLTSLAKDYFDKIEAPLKKMVLIKDAGHFAAFCQPEQFLNELLVQFHALANIPGE